MEYLFRNVLRIALHGFHVTNRFETLSGFCLRIILFQPLLTRLDFNKMLVPFKVFIFHGRKPNGSDKVLTFRLFVVLPASCFDSYANLFNVL